MHAGHFSLEEFESTESSPFLQPRTNTNVLNYLCTDPIAKQDIARCIVTSLFHRDMKFIKTEFHAKWAMECLGYAFSLPIEQAEIIHKAIQIYANWLNPIHVDSRPECIAEDEGFYQREIVNHFSLLFVERPVYPPNGLTKHAELCKSTLTTLRDFTHQTDLSKETWSTVLKMLLLVAKPLLDITTPKVIELGPHVGPLLVRTILELWVQSNTRELRLWSELQECTAKWTHHIWLIKHWSSIVLGLTKRVINLIYSVGSSNVTFEFMAPGQLARTETVHSDMQVEQVVYFWYQFLSMMLNNTKDQTPVDPENHHELVLKVSHISDFFLDVCEQRNSQRNLDSPVFVKPPNLSSGLAQVMKEFEKQHFQYLTRMSRLPIPSATGILDLLGPWFFAQASRTYYFEKGRAQAIGALCRIVCKGAGPVKDEYLAKFYLIVFRCLEGKDLAASEVIRNSQNLLTLNHKGVRQLLSSQGIPKAVEEYLSDRDSDIAIRRACYSILVTYIALPYYYLSNQMFFTGPNMLNSIKAHYEILAQSVKEVLTITQENERENESVKTLAWLICVFLATSPSAGKLIDNDHYSRFVRGLVYRLEAEGTDLILYLELLEVLTSLAFLLKTKSLGNIDEVVKPVVTKLCEYITGKVGKIGPNDVSLSALYLCLLTWLVAFPSVFEDIDLRKHCLEVTIKGVVNEQAKEYATYVQYYLLTRLELQLPPIHFAEYQQIIFSVSSAKLTSQAVDMPGKHYVIGDEVLVSIFDSSKYNIEHDEALIVIRDCIGRYVWKVETVYRTPGVPSSNSPNLFKLRDPRKEAGSSGDSEPQIEAALISQFDDSEKEDFTQFSELIRSQKELEKEFLGSYQPEQVKVIPESQTQANVPKSHRMILSTLGLLCIQNADVVLPVEGQEVTTAMRALDRMPEKDKYTLTVIYLQIPESTEAISSKSTYSESFQEFMKSLGVKVSDEDGLPAIYEHLSDTAESVGSFLYSTDFSYEFITISPSIMSAEKLKGYSFQRLTNAAEVVLLWNERVSDHFSEKQPQLMENAALKKKMIIIITPLGKGLSRVNLNLNQRRPPSGPLLNDMVVPNLHLAQLVIRTTINLYGTWNSNRVGLWKRRKEQLSSLVLAAKRVNKTERLTATLVHAFRL